MGVCAWKSEHTSASVLAPGISCHLSRVSDRIASKEHPLSNCVVPTPAFIRCPSGDSSAFSHRGARKESWGGLKGSSGLWPPTKSRQWLVARTRPVLFPFCLPLLPTTAMPLRPTTFLWASFPASASFRPEAACVPGRVLEGEHAALEPSGPLSSCQRPCYLRAWEGCPRPAPLWLLVAASKSRWGAHHSAAASDFTRPSSSPRGSSLRAPTSRSLIMSAKALFSNKAPWVRTWTCLFWGHGSMHYTGCVIRKVPFTPISPFFPLHPIPGLLCMPPSLQPVPHA